MSKNTTNSGLCKQFSYKAAQYRASHPRQSPPAPDGSFEQACRHFRQLRRSRVIGNADHVLACALAELTLGTGRLEDYVALDQMPIETGLARATCITSKDRLVKLGVLRRANSNPGGSVYAVNLDFLNTMKESNPMKVITAKYKSICPACKGAILPGEQISYIPGRGNSVHMSCPAAVPAVAKPAVPLKSTYERILELRSKCGDCRYEDLGGGYIRVQRCLPCERADKRAKEQAGALAQWKATATPEELAKMATGGVQ